MCAHCQWTGLGAMPECLCARHIARLPGGQQRAVDACMRHKCILLPLCGICVERKPDAWMVSELKTSLRIIVVLARY